MRSVFHRFGRFPPSLEIDQRENRLTEAFASVLEHVDGLSGALVAEWTQAQPPEGRARLRTQRPTVGGRFVDLEISFGPATRPELRVWVEIKYGADLHDEQLANYIRDLGQELQDKWCLVLLAPRQSFPEDSDGTTPVQWQQLGRFLQRHAARTDFSDAGRWLLAQFLSYLKEQGLMDDEALTPAHAFELSARPAAERTIGRVVEAARPIIDDAWGSPNNYAKKGKKPALGVGWWASYPVQGETTWGSAWFEWNLREDGFRPEPRDAIAFFAGITFESAKTAPFARAGNESWLAAVDAKGFERVQPWYWGFWRPLYPEQLLTETYIEVQAERLADWVLDTFRQLDASPPPN
jgi:hypothetical protein